jgi:hypothetical protein
MSSRQRNDIVVGEWVPEGRNSLYIEVEDTIHRQDLSMGFESSHDCVEEE